MLLTLSIANFILISKEVLDFGSGFTAMTGETGAGKSILLDALTLALGVRASGKYHLNPAMPVDIIAEFDIGNNPNVQAIMAQHEITPSETLLLRRVITPDGRSKAFINDTLASLNLIQELAQFLVELSGQHDQQSLLRSEVQLAILDEYAGHSLADVHQAYNTWHDIEAQLATSQAEYKAAQQEQEYLAYAANQLQELDVQLDEEEALLKKRKLLQDRQKIIEAVQIGCHELTGSGGIVSKLHTSQRALAKINDIAGYIITTLEQAALELEEAAVSLEQIGHSATAEEMSLDQVEERLFDLRNAARKYGISVAQLPQHLAEIERKLMLASGDTAALAELSTQVSLAKQSYYEVAQALHQSRVDVAGNLQSAVMLELEQLRMPHAAVLISVIAAHEATAWGKDGLDYVEFKVRTNPGMPFERINKVASGGELSRLMLAFKIALSGVKCPPLVIFDEIDVGVGGAVADSIGRKLAQLVERQAYAANTSNPLGVAQQVLAVTHQPQVAVHAQHHYLVQKKHDHKQATVSLTLLDATQRCEEIARMLSGEIITAESMAAAKAMLENVA